MSKGEASLGDVFRAWRDSATRLNDLTTVHFCELALVGVARRESPSAALAAAVAPLRRLAHSKTIHGVDKLCADLILAAVSVGADELRWALQGVLLKTGRVDAVERTIGRLLTGLTDEAEHLRPAILLAALDLAVAIGHFSAGAEVLETLAAHHGSKAETARQLLCLRQAALHREKAGDEAHAEVLWRTIGELTDAVPSASDEIRRADADALERTGAYSAAIQLRLALANRQMDGEALEGALESLEHCLSLAEVKDSPEVQAEVHRRLSLCFQSIGDEDLATDHAVKAELLSPDEGDG